MARSLRAEDVFQWGVEDVADWLSNGLDLPAQAKMFHDMKIDGPTLLQLTPEELETQFAQDNEMESWIAMKKIIGHVNIFRWQSGQEDSVTTAPITSVGRSENKSAAESFRSPRMLSSRGLPPTGSFTSMRPATSSQTFRARIYSPTRERRPQTSSSVRQSERPPPVSQSTLALGRKGKGSFSKAARKIDECLYLVGGASPGVCAYNSHMSDSNRKMGGVIGRATRWEGRARVLDRSPGPMSYSPNFLAKSKLR